MGNGMPFDLRQSPFSPPEQACATTKKDEVMR